VSHTDAGVSNYELRCISKEITNLRKKLAALEARKASLQDAIAGLGKMGAS